MTIPLHFQLPSVRVDNSVWTWLSKEKLDNLRLSTAPIVDKCVANIEQFAGSSMIVIRHAPANALSQFGVTIVNMNTAKEFREFDRSAMLQLYADSFPEHSPYHTRLFVVSFADLKTYTFTFNVGIPSVSPSEYSHAAESISTTVPPHLLVHVSTPLHDRHITVVRDDGVEFFESEKSICTGDVILVPDWGGSCTSLPYYVRDILSGMARAISSSVTVSICLGSRLYFSTIHVSPSSSLRLVPGWARWALPNTSAPTTIQSVDLRRFLDPATIAKDAVSLNIKLIKWRLLPDFQPEKMSQLKCLLIGAGTLGCAVGRCLQSWGVEHMTFVDCGTVSYSNPSRQWLFRLEDAISYAPKAETAAKRLREIVPSDHVTGVTLSVPLPGHPADLAELDSTFEKLSDLISSHDVVFLLTDSRESRWLPSLLARHKQIVLAEESSNGGLPTSVCISVALGFDSYLVKVQSPSTACYFCNDVNAPSDSTSFRTLDQQCTVTRPGVAAIASCTAVELLATHVTGEVLGSAPDQIRGFLGTHQTCPATTENFKHCICCSDPVGREFATRGLEFVRKVVADGNVLMDVSGLGEYNSRISELDVVCWSDDEGV